MMAVAAIVRIPMRSSASAQARNTATTGFTYAKVETCDDELTVSSQVKTVNAMIEPNTIRQAKAKTDFSVTAATLSALASPASRLAISSVAPPATICIAAESTLDAGSFTRLL